MADAVVEIVWGLHFAGMMAQCSDCDTTYRVTNRDELDAWAGDHWLTEHPWAKRVRVVHVIDDRGAKVRTVEWRETPGPTGA